MKGPCGHGQDAMGGGGSPSDGGGDDGSQPIAGESICLKRIYNF
jgi:hypothetical protein